jgi:hypothetical protein
MTGILGYARVSTGDQDVAGQTMRLTQAGAIKVFTDVRSGRSMDRPGLENWEDRKTNFDVIVGQSVPEDRDARYVGLVHGYDRKPKRRLFDVLTSQGLQANQEVTFLTDGGEEV